MKKVFLVGAAFAIYAAFRRISQQQVTPTRKPALPVDELAHRLQDAWADHHTSA